MKVTLNGTVVDHDAASLGGLLADLLADLGGLPDGHAVAVNGEVVPRAVHAARPLADGDVVEVVTAVAGG
jgi:sulfur carrier protein